MVQRISRIAGEGAPAEDDFDPVETMEVSYTVPGSTEKADSGHVQELVFAETSKQTLVTGPRILVSDELEFLVDDLVKVCACSKLQGVHPRAAKALWNRTGGAMERAMDMSGGTLVRCQDLRKREQEVRELRRITAAGDLLIFVPP
eukprot:Skav203864  [mRNA]  locus=scaffold1031:93784:95323:- [translate_table: standard]